MTTQPELDTEAMLAELHALVGDDTTPTSSPAGEVDEAPALEAPVVEAGEGEGDGSPSAEASIETGPPPSPPGFVNFNGEQVPVETAQALLELDKRMREDPELAGRVTEAVKPRTPDPVAPEPPKAPDWLEDADPVARALWDEFQANKADLARLQARFEEKAASEQAGAEEQRKAEVVDAWGEAVKDFRETYPNLTDEQFSKVANGLPPGLVDSFAASEHSLRAGFVKALDTTLWADPQNRSLVLESGGATVPSNKDRKQKSSALAGTSGSAPRETTTPKRPQNREELVAAMTDAWRNDPDFQS